VGQIKKDDEGIRFHTLLTVGMHCGGQILPEKLQQRVCSWAALVLMAGVLGRGSAGGGSQGEGLVVMLGRTEGRQRS
jgi:hypothetical protein